MDKLPKKNDVLVVKYGFDKNIWYVHEEIGSYVRIGPRTWFTWEFLMWDLKDLNSHEAEVVGRCYRFWPFRFFRFHGKGDDNER